VIIIIKTLGATFDDKLLHPDIPIDLRPNTKVNITIEICEAEVSKPASFLKTTCSIDLKVPPDWSEKLEEYLYGGFTYDNRK
jgi:hypothetical protein